MNELRAAYERWWVDVSRRFDEYCEIIVGSPEENPTCLMTHDLHGQVVWNQYQVRRGERADGFWVVEVARDGEYEFSLRRWPKEVDIPITAAISEQESEPESERIGAADARLKVADVDLTKHIPTGATEVSFRVKLKAGNTRVQAWFINGLGAGETLGAYYVYARYLT